MSQSPLRKTLGDEYCDKMVQRWEARAEYNLKSAIFWEGRNDELARKANDAYFRALAMAERWRKI